MSVSSDQRMKGQGNHGNNGDYNSWGGSVNQGGSQYHSRKGGHGYDDYNNYNNSNRGAYGINDGGVKHVERGMQGLGLGGGHHDRNVPNSSHGGGGGGSGGGQQQQQQQKDAPRKMTWASIASQPAKPTVTATSTISKKKGPGMPPPPMVPGRHNMDIGNWDSPSKNGPPLVPPTFNSEPQQSVPPVSASFADDPPPSSHNRQQANGGSGGGNGASGPAWPTPGQAMTAQHPPQSQVLPMQQQQQQQQQETQRRPERPHMSHYNHHHESAGGGMMNQNSDGGFRRGGPPHPMQPPSHQHHSNNYMPQQPNYSHSSAAVPAAPPQASQPQQPTEDTTEALNRLLDMSKYNPTNYEIENVDLARFFVIKSYSEDDIHRSIKYNIWCSTEHGNKRLDQAFHEREKEGGAVYLFYSVNGSGHFCGMAQMISPVDYSSNSSVWAQDKWKGSFKVRWVYVKDVPNANLRHIRLENNENKPVTNSRDTQEVPNAKGQQVWRIIQSYTHSTSLFDDFVHYEQRQQEESTRRVEPGPSPQSSYRTGSPQMFDNKYNNQQQDRSGDRGGRYGEQNNNPRDMGPASGPYDRGYQSSDTKYSSGYNNRNNYGNSTFDRGSYSRGNSGGYNNREYGYRRDDQGSRGGDGENGPPSGGYHSRGGGGNYRNNRGGFNNDYYNSRRQDNRDRGERGGYRPQGNSIDYANE